MKTARILFSFIDCAILLYFNKFTITAHFMLGQKTGQEHKETQH